MVDNDAHQRETITRWPILTNLKAKGACHYHLIDKWAGMRIVGLYRLKKNKTKQTNKQTKQTQQKNKKQKQKQIQKK